MELRHLRYFVAVGRVLHFGRAAEQLHIAQPALSQQIKALESELGVLLLERTNRRVELTDAGRAFLAAAAEVLANVAKAGETARLIGAGKTGRLRVSYARSAPEGVATRIVEEFRRAQPAIEVVINTAYTARNVEDLVEGSIDAAFVRPPIDAGPRLASLVVGDEAFVAVLPKGHRLARRKRLARTDLRDEPVVTGARERGPGFFDTMFGAIWGERRPNVVQVEADEEHILRAVSRGVGVSVITESRANTLSFPGVVVLRFVEPQPRVPLALAWRRGKASPALARFLETARVVAGQSAAPSGGRTRN